MKFPYSMLLDFVTTDLDAFQIGDLLTMAGFELEGIESVEGDEVLDIKVMSNRGDGLSVFGLSREVLAKDANATATDLYRHAATRFADVESKETTQLENEVATIESEDCNRFACRAFSQIKGNHSSPEWMQKRLRQAGQRPISLLVDLTNYVMLELGQPLHAFDRDQLKGRRIVVRNAKEGEKLTTLNGIEHTLSGQMMICDAERPVGVPGVMGGLETEVTDKTQNLLLESANFKNTTVRKTRKQLGLSTDASYRFERSVDPDGVVGAIQRFTALLLASAPEAEVSNIVDHYPRPPKTEPVQLRLVRASSLLGMKIEAEEAERYLSGLGMSFQAVNGAPARIKGRQVPGPTYLVTPPAWRQDIVREDDLVEELGRVHGYERIPDDLPEGLTTLGGPQGDHLAVDRIGEAAIRAGFIQMISHSLRDFHPLDSATNRIGPRVIASPEHAILRNSLLPSLADAAQRNGSKNLHLFEIGKVFAVGTPDGERRHIAFLSTGDLLLSDRQNAVLPQADYFSLKGSLDSVLGALLLSVTYAHPSVPDPRFHPTRQAQISIGGHWAGRLGQIHPDLAESLKLSPATYLAELDLDTALAKGSDELTIKSISRNPSVRRDIAVLVEKAIPYDQLKQAIDKACGDLLERQWLFDIFEGTGIPEGKHSLGIGLQFRKAGENFTDEEANQVRDLAVAALAEFGATLR